MVDIMKTNRPRILMLIDKRKWAFDVSARQIAMKLKEDFHFDLRYVQEKPELNPSQYDLLYVFFWGETYYQNFGFKPEQIIKEVSSHRWEDDPLYGPCTPSEFADKYLNDCRTVICTSLRLLNIIKSFHPKVYHTPNGISSFNFKKVCTRSGKLTIGWAGNIKDEVKGFNDILEPICGNRYSLVMADGTFSHTSMNRFYNKLDVLAICSRHEGEPLTLVEAMAAGCFPVCVDVGIVPELIEHGVNGFIVSERTTDAFAKAFEWCEVNIDKIRKAGDENARLIKRERNWDVCAQYFKRVFLDVYNEVSQPKFRNDDVSWDTSLEAFTKFCGVFHKYGLTQVHGVTLSGATSTLKKFMNTPVEYDGYDTLAKLDNQVIRKLSDPKLFEERFDLIDYLNSIPDEIALHGLYHTDYSKMTYYEQKYEIMRGLDILNRLFPQKNIAYFIPPFNRTNEFTYKVCSELKLNVLTTAGVHLESELDHLVLRRKTWYRYHHHRFYPESVFSYYDLSIEKLDAALDKAMSCFQKYPEQRYPESQGFLSKLVNLIGRFHS